MINGQFVVLALYEVHMASAALLIDGEIIAAAHEERFSRIKNDVGFPLQAAQFCLNYAKISHQNVDVVPMLNEYFPPDGVANILFKRMAVYSCQDWIDENERYWYPKLIEKKKIESYFHSMGGWARVPKEHFYDLSQLDMNAPPGEISEKFNFLRKKAVQDHLDINKEKVRFVPHYMCHHYHAYYSGPLRGSEVAVIHAEGDGGKYNQAVSQPTTEGLKIIAGTNQFNLGRLYQWITLLLGMKPYHHEFKLMGLAPHANSHEVKRSLQIFEPLFETDRDNLIIRFRQQPDDLYYTFLNRLRGHRFDGIAGALQKVLEDRLVEWVSAVIQHTGCSKIAYGGGVAMNIKANMHIWQIDEVKHLFVPLSPGDESNVFGAGYWLTEKHFIQNDKNPEDIPALISPYLGKEYTRLEIKKALAATDLSEFDVKDEINESYVAGMLSEGMVVARSSGRAEFGQRALGNRSILANPSLKGTVDKINHQIKYRDFWMPFAPTILDKNVDTYLDNPKKLLSPFMTIGFPSRREKQNEIFQALHPSDHSARPQILTAKTNPNYYRLIEKFEELTGIGCLLNTSFNLHGEPIADSPYDALHVFCNSELDALWMDDFLVTRRKNQEI